MSIPHNANLEILSNLQLGVVKYQFVRVLVTIKLYMYNVFLKSSQEF